MFSFCLVVSSLWSYVRMWGVLAVLRREARRRALISHICPWFCLFPQSIRPRMQLRAGCWITRHLFRQHEHHWSTGLSWWGRRQAPTPEGQSRKMSAGFQVGLFKCSTIPPSCLINAKVHITWGSQVVTSLALSGGNRHPAWLVLSMNITSSLEQHRRVPLLLPLSQSHLMLVMSRWTKPTSPHQFNACWCCH